MSQPDKDLVEERIFQFPFQPYEIQQAFMNHLYHVLENDKIGIFESPTGTGKSLSLICGTLTWLCEYEERKKQEAQQMLLGNFKPVSDVVDEETKSSTEPDWVDEFFQQKANKELMEKLKDQEINRKTQKDKLEEIRKQRQLKKRKREHDESSDKDATNEKNPPESEEDEEFIIADYTSDNETTTLGVNDDKENSSSDEENSPSEEENDHVKVFYCSRTHSQLTQFIHEVQKSPFANKIKVTVLASRQNYCINEEVRKLKYNINEKCLELQKTSKEKKKKNSNETRPQKKKRKGKKSGCEFYGQKKFHEFKEHAMAEVQDIEQLLVLGQDLDTCPYYGSRYSISESQLVVLPYQTLLHKSTRDSVGINLQGSIVIVDEGHNLIETINNIHSVEITASQISQSIQQLTQYRDRYKKRLKMKNNLYIEQILFILKSMLAIFGDTQSAVQESSLKTINNFVYDTKIDNVNLFKIHRYCEKSLISKKLNGFVDKYELFTNENNNNNQISYGSSFVYIENFLNSLNNADKNGRILITKNKLLSKSSLKFLLLNPAVHFVDVLRQCKAVVVAGGTMQPVSEFKSILLHSANVTNDKIVEFSCGHVIPPENLVVASLSTGPSSVDLDFTFQNRNKHELIDELGRLILNICTIVPGGVVCFFASYDYEDLVYSRWTATGLLVKIQNKKKVFREPRKSCQCDKVLAEYASSIKMRKNDRSAGALLLSVVGGKMSEGINFSDDLGRCILMAGLPYPNINSPELKEKMTFLDKTIGPTAGQEHYENICMKAVNQSIGRAIRHKGDYAAILLLDRRYSRRSVQSKLPSWISTQMNNFPRFGPGFAAVSKFFAGKRGAVS